MQTGNLLELELRARQMGELFQLLPRIRGLRLDEHYVIKDVVACGGSSLVCAAEDIHRVGRNVACKIPLLPYHSPAAISLAATKKAAARLRREATVLDLLKSPLWPKLEGLITGPNPLAPCAWNGVISCEIGYLLMEWIEGDSIAERCRHLLRRNAGRELEAMIWAALPKIVAALCDACAAGFVYVDLKPRHIIVADQEGGTIRLLDAGGFFERSTEALLEEVTPGYLPPQAYREWVRDGRLAVDETLAIHGLGKTLLASCSNWEMIPGKEYRAADYIAHLSPKIRDYVDGLLQLRWRTLEEVREATYDSSGSAVIATEQAPRVAAC